jgi:hypothetical protein
MKDDRRAIATLQAAIVREETAGAELALFYRVITLARSVAADELALQPTERTSVECILTCLREVFSATC